MATALAAIDGAWVPLAEAATVLGVSTDTVRRRMRAGQLESRMAGQRYLVHVTQEDIHAAPRSTKTLVNVEEVHPSVKAVLKYLEKRDQARDREVEQLREELARARADLVAAYAEMASSRPWNPGAWLRQLWVSQSRHIHPALNEATQ